MAQCTRELVAANHWYPAPLPEVVDRHPDADGVENRDERKPMQRHTFYRTLSLAGASLMIGAAGALAATIGASVTPAGAAPVADPVMCNITGTASFSPPLTQSGVNSGKGSVETVTLSGFSESDCLSSSSSGAPSSGSVSNATISVEATKSGSGKSAEYLTGYCPGFASASSLKALKHITLNSNWSGGEGSSTQVETKSAGIATNSLGEGGFSIAAKYLSGSYPLKVVQITIYLTAAETDTLASGCTSGPVSSITFDGATSTILQ